MKINQSRPFLILAAIAAFSLSSAPVMAAGIGINVDPGTSIDEDTGSAMDLGCGDLVVNGTLTLHSSTPITGVRHVIIGAAGIINATDGGSITLSGNWGNSNGAAGFLAGDNSQVTWDRTCTPLNPIQVTGDTTFHNFTLNDGNGREIDFAAGSHTTINATGMMIMTGGASLLTIRSDSSPSQAYLKVLGDYTINHVDVQDNNAELPGKWIDYGPAASFNSVDSGNNNRWFRSYSVTFNVYKNWAQSNVPAGTPVDVHILCSSGEHLNQTTTVSAAQHVTFTVNGISPDPTKCTITESVPAGYTASYDVSMCGSESCSDTNATSCVFENVYDDGYQGGHECDITNTPDPTTITLTKTWILAGGDSGFDGGYKVKLYCDSEIDAPSDSGKSWTSWDWCNKGKTYCGAGIRADSSDGSQVYEFSLPVPAYQGECTLVEEAKDSLVQIDLSDCVPKDGSVQQSRHENEVSTVIAANSGDEIACEIVNTVFFEGIPTLNRFGMAILALLMLGVGLIGFRRLV